jgi:Fe-Mn family superoxide dismutase
MAYTLPELKYAYNALEPIIDARTMEIHHTKHHQAYVTNLNKALESASVEAPECVCCLIKDIGKLPEAIQTAVRNNGGGHVNHSLFWELLTPGGSKAPVGKVAEKINEAFGSLEKFKEAFAAAAATRFGSGWAWLAVKPDGSVAVMSTPNQDNPVMGSIYGYCGCKPVIGLDVWEHAYYLNYQNRRPDYINAFWSVLNWDVVEARYQRITSK